MSGACGDCTMCCRVFAIAELQKPLNKWCKHCDIGKGCRIYETRPAVCVDFACIWLESHKRGFPMNEDLRPDRCKVMFAPTTNDNVVTAVTMPGMSSALNSKPVRELIKKLVDDGMGVTAGVTGATSMLFFDKEGSHSVEMTEPDENGMQWGNRNGGTVKKISVRSTRQRFKRWPL